MSSCRASPLCVLGTRIVVDGMQNNVSGVIELVMDGGDPIPVNLWAADVICGNLVNYTVANGSHTLTMTLSALQPALNETGPIGGGEGGSLTPVLHLTDITYAHSIVSSSSNVLYRSTDISCHCRQDPVLRYQPQQQRQ
jgi:hypothetical protein